MRGEANDEFRQVGFVIGKDLVSLRVLHSDEPSGYVEQVEKS